MILKAHKIGWGADIRPGRSDRKWMDQTPDRFAYRCTPLPMANSSGWEISFPFSFEAEWHGGDHPDNITVYPGDDLLPIHRGNMNHLVCSVFGSGILTFHTGYVFRTDENMGMWVRGVPNTFKDGIHPLDGLVETYWLPFTFTMNWKFTRPCRIKFHKDEPFCFISLFPHGEVDKVEPVIEPWDDQFKIEYDIFQQSRADFVDKLKKQDPETVKAKWQKHYFKGVTPNGKKADFHVNKRKLNPFVENV